MNSPAPREGLLSKHRLEGLSDGVFSIMLTLLVLDLKLDHLPSHLDDAAIWHQLRELARPLFGYTVTFGLAGMFWLLQHRKFHLLTHTTVRHAWLTLLFLFWVSLLPFSISLWARAPGLGAGLTIYYGNMTLIAASLLAGWLDARHSGLVAVDQSAAARRLTYRITAMTTAFVVSTAVCYVAPQMAIYPLLTIVVISRVMTKKFAPAAA